MRYIINTLLSSNLKDTLRACISAKIGVELHYTQTKKEEPLLEKADINSIEGDIRDYKYLLFFAQNSGAEYVLFHPEKNELKKIPDIIKEGKEKGISIAIENNKEWGRTPSDIYKITKEIDGLKFVFNPCIAKECSLNPTGFIKMLKDKIIGINISDFYRGISGLPYSLGESDFLDPIIEEFKDSKIPFVIKLEEKYDFNDALISIDKIKSRVKELKKTS